MHQAQSNWCWAATGEAVIDYVANTCTDQCVVAEGWLTVAGTAPPGGCCPSDARCNDPFDPIEELPDLYDPHGLKATEDWVIAEDSLHDALNCDLTPVLLGLRTGRSSQHVVVAVGTEAGEVWINDPLAEPGADPIQWTLAALDPWWGWTFEVCHGDL